MIKKILIVDDERELVQLLKSRLAREGFDVAEAFNGAECLEKARSEKPDLILLDIYMPIMDGFQALGELKSDICLKQIPTIIFSAKATADQVQKAETMGAQAFFKKPLEIMELVKQINQALQNG